MKLKWGKQFFRTRRALCMKKKKYFFEFLRFAFDVSMNQHNWGGLLVLEFTVWSFESFFGFMFGFHGILNEILVI
jgi:hypothetical protein